MRTHIAALLAAVCLCAAARSAAALTAPAACDAAAADGAGTPGEWEMLPDQDAGLALLPDEVINATVQVGERSYDPPAGRQFHS